MLPVIIEREGNTGEKKHRNDKHDYAKTLFHRGNPIG